MDNDYDNVMKRRRRRRYPVFRIAVLQLSNDYYEKIWIKQKDCSRNLSKNCSNLALVFWCRIMCLFSLWCKVFGKIKVKLCLLVSRLIGAMRCAEKGVTAKIDRQKIGGQREKDHQGYKVCADDGILRHRWNLSPTPKHQGMAMPWNLLQKPHFGCRVGDINESSKIISSRNIKSQS